MVTLPRPKPSSSSADLFSQFASARSVPRPVIQTSPSSSTSTHGRRHSPSPATPFQTARSPASALRTSSSLSSCATIKSMDSHASATIRAAHTILDTAAIIKELAENSLDAGATRIDVRLRGKAGLDSIVVSDNGHGIKQNDHATMCLSSTTSKLRHDSDMSSAAFTTFGFRGEALAAIRRVCASLSIVTRTSSDASATTLSFATDGSLVQSTPAARPIGTTVSISRVFYALPVRRKDAISNAHRELARCVSVVQALAIISVHARVELRVANDLKVRSTGVSNITSKTKLNEFTLSSLRTSTQSVIGSRATSTLLDVEKRSIASITVPPMFRDTVDADNHAAVNINKGSKFKTEYLCMGLVSRASLDADGSGGRARSSHQYMYVNERPVDFPRVARAANEMYRRATGLSSASPTIILNFVMPTWACDVNLAPDKRHVLVHDEDLLIAGVVKMLEDTWIHTAEAPIPIQKQANLKQQASILSAFPRISTPTKDPNQIPAPCLASPVGGNEQILSHLNRDGNQDGNKTKLDVKNDENRIVSSSKSPHGVEAAPLNKDGKEDGNSDELKLEIPQPERDIAVPTPPQSPQQKRADFESDHQIHRNESDDANYEPMAQTPDISAFARTRSRQTPKEPFADVINRLKRPLAGTKRRLGGNFAHSAQEVLSSDFSQMTHRDVLAMTSKRQDALERRSVLEYAGQRAKRRTSYLNSFLSGGGHDGGCDCCPPKNSRNSGALGLKPSGECRSRPRRLAPFPPESRIRHHDPDMKTGGDDVEGPSGVKSSVSFDNVNIVMDGSADDDIELTTGRLKPQFAIQVNWTELCDDGDEDGSETEKADDVASGTAGFEKASMAGSGESSEIEAADQELSRLFRQEWFKQLRVIGQFNRGFIIGQLNREVFIIDQHASDEKYNYEDLQATTQLQRQGLVIPRALEMSAEDELIVVQHLKLLNASGYEIRYHPSNSPTNRLTLHAQPVSKHIVFGEDDLLDIIYMLKNGIVTNAKHIKPPRVQAMLASRACRKSIMIGTALHRHEMKLVLDHLSGILHPWTCPHGRPTMRHLCTLPTSS